MKELAARGHEVSNDAFLLTQRLHNMSNFVTVGNCSQHIRTDRKTVEELSIHRSGTIYGR